MPDEVFCNKNPSLGVAVTPAPERQGQEEGSLRPTWTIGDSVSKVKEGPESSSAGKGQLTHLQT